MMSHSRRYFRPTLLTKYGIDLPQEGIPPLMFVSRWSERREVVPLVIGKLNG
jgi:hypothetical protein